MACVANVWYIRPETRRMGHPAPFPEEIPRRLIKLYTYPNDIVLDPFMGSGTTAVAASRLGRRWIGFDISEKYAGITYNRLESERKKYIDLATILRE